MHGQGRESIPLARSLRAQSFAMKKSWGRSWASIYSQGVKSNGCWCSAHSLLFIWPNPDALQTPFLWLELPPLPYPRMTSQLPFSGSNPPPLPYLRMTPQLPFSGSNPPPHPYLIDSGTPFLLTFNATTIETNSTETNSTETNSTSGRG